MKKEILLFKDIYPYYTDKNKKIDYDIIIYL